MASRIHRTERRIPQAARAAGPGRTSNAHAWGAPARQPVLPGETRDERWLRALRSGLENPTTPRSFLYKQVGGAFGRWEQWHQYAPRRRKAGKTRFRCEPK